MKSLNEGWVSQNASKRNGLLLALPDLFHWKEMGQWSKPAYGRIIAAISPPKWTALSDKRNRSSLDAIWCLLVLQLLHVCVPLQNWKSIRALFWMNSLKCSFSYSILVRPPCFSSNLVFMLKSPPIIHRGWTLCRFSASIVPSKAILLPASCGK